MLGEDVNNLVKEATSGMGMPPLRTCTRYNETLLDVLHFLIKCQFSLINYNNLVVTIHTNKYRRDNTKLLKKGVRERLGKRN